VAWPALGSYGPWIVCMIYAILLGLTLPVPLDTRPVEEHGYLCAGREKVLTPAVLSAMNAAGTRKNR